MLIFHQNIYFAYFKYSVNSCRHWIKLYSLKLKFPQNFWNSRAGKSGQLHILDRLQCFLLFHGKEIVSLSFQLKELSICRTFTDHCLQQLVLQRETRKTLKHETSVFFTWSSKVDHFQRSCVFWVICSVIVTGHAVWWSISLHFIRIMFFHKFLHQRNWWNNFVGDIRRAW